MRPTQYGVEMHLLTIHDVIDSFRPAAVVIDPVSNLTSIAVIADIKSMFARLLDTLKNSQITTLSTDLTTGGRYQESTEIGLSSIMDTWIVLKNREKNDHRERIIEIIKSRGMAHTASINRFEITAAGFVISKEKVK
jgi:circadian clock protein KaiC